MSLPSKKSRSIEVNGKNYRWMVGKVTDVNANVAIEAPDGVICTFNECVEIPITPAYVRNLIIDNNI